VVVEKRVGVGLGVEGDEVVDLFAGADEADGQAEFAGDGDDDAAFGGAVELGEDDAGHADGRGELASLSETVLAGSGVHHQEDVVGSARNHFCGGAFHFFEFKHEIGFGVETAGGVDDYGIGAAGFCCSHGVEDYRGGVGAGFLFDEFDAVALGPDFELFDRGSAEGVRGAKDDAAAILAEAIGEFADAGGFAGTVYADDEDDAGVVAVGGAYQVRGVSVDIEGTKNVFLDFVF